MTHPISEKKLDVAALLEGTTPGPWMVREQCVEGADPEAVGSRNNSIWRETAQGFYPVVALGQVRPKNGGQWVSMCSITPEDAALIAAVKRIAAEHTALTKKVDELEAALDDLQQAEAEYRLMHDRHGDGSRASGRAWDLMRRAGNKARTALNDTTQCRESD